MGVKKTKCARVKRVQPQSASLSAGLGGSAGVQPAAGRGWTRQSCRRCDPGCSGSAPQHRGRDGAEPSERWPVLAQPVGLGRDCSWPSFPLLGATDLSKGGCAAWGPGDPARSVCLGMAFHFREEDGKLWRKN